MKKQFRIFLTFAFFLFIILPQITYSQVKRDTIRVLFIGNSYTYYNNLEQIVSAISDSTHTKIIAKKSTIGGAKLSEHWHGARGLHTKEMIQNGHFDVVVLQEYSMSPINEPDSTYKYMGLFCNYIKQHGAKPFLYLTWARKRVPQFQDDLNKVYFEVAKKQDATLVPVGVAWAASMQIRPAIELFHFDETHPSALGTFLNACIFTAAITGEVPKRLSGHYSIPDRDGESVELMNIDDLDVIFCLKVTKQVIGNYKK